MIHQGPSLSRIKVALWSQRGACNQWIIPHWGNHRLPHSAPRRGSLKTFRSSKDGNEQALILPAWRRSRPVPGMGGGGRGGVRGGGGEGGEGKKGRGGREGWEWGGGGGGEVGRG